MLVPAIVAILNRRKAKVLRLAEAALPAAQFRAFRALMLDEFGRDLEKDLERALAELAKERNGQGQADTRREGGAR